MARGIPSATPARGAGTHLLNHTRKPAIWVSLSWCSTRWNRRDIPPGSSLDVRSSEGSPASGAAMQRPMTRATEGHRIG